MRALLITTGSEGDFQPFLALAQRMKREGHDVVLAASNRYQPRARRSAVQLRELAKDWDVVVYPPLMVAAVAAARALGKPHVSVHLAPLHRACTYGPTGAPRSSLRSCRASRRSSSASDR